MGVGGRGGEETHTQTRRKPRCQGMGETAFERVIIAVGPCIAMMHCTSTCLRVVCRRCIPGRSQDRGHGFARHGLVWVEGVRAVPRLNQIEEGWRCQGTSGAALKTECSCREGRGASTAHAELEHRLRSRCGAQDTQHRATVEEKHLSWAPNPARDARPTELTGRTTLSQAM